MMQGRLRPPPRHQRSTRQPDTPRDHWKLERLKSLDDILWLRFMDVCGKPEVEPVRAVEILLDLYVSDASFTPTPTTPTPNQQFESKSE